MNTIILSIITGLGFGTALFFRKLSLQQIGMNGFVIEAIVEAILALIFVPLLFHSQFAQLSSKPLGVMYGVLAGLVITIGVIAYVLAIKNGTLTPSVVGPILAALTASTLALIILREPVSIPKLFGMILAMVGLYIFIKY